MDHHSDSRLVGEGEERNHTGRHRVSDDGEGNLECHRTTAGRTVAANCADPCHPDHIGGLQRILHANPVPVYAHRVEIPYIEGELPYRQGKKPVAYMQKGAVQALSEDEHGQLRSIGSLMPFNTPGHSPGHVVFYHEEDQVLLAGDLFT